MIDYVYSVTSKSRGICTAKNKSIFGKNENNLRQNLGTGAGKLAVRWGKIETLNKCCVLRPKDYICGSRHPTYSTLFMAKWPTLNFLPSIP